MILYFYAFIAIFLTSPVFAASTYWVRPTGTMSACTPSATPPESDSGYKSTINAGIACLGSGDTLYIRTGTYVENVDIATSKSGTSWSSFTLISGYQSEVVTNRPSASRGGAQMLAMDGTGWQYIEIANIIFDGNYPTIQPPIGTPCIKASNGAHHIRFRSIELKNCDSSGFLVGPASTSIWMEFIDLNVHDMAKNPSYQPGGNGIYIEGNDNLVDGGIFWNNSRGYGVRAWDSGSGTAERNIIQNARFFSNQAAMSISDHDNIVRNNLIYSNTGGIQFARWKSTTGTKIYNNTFYGNSTGGASASVLEIDAPGNIGGINVFRNNLLVSNSGSNINNSSTITYSNNLCTVSSAACAGVISEESIAFVNAAGQNWALNTGSAAIDVGTSSIATGIARSFNGSAPDVGAHETFVFSSCSVESGDPSTLRIVFINNVYPPIAGISTTGFTYRINAGASNNPNAAVSSGTNQINLTLQAPVTAGQTIDFSYTTAGSIRDTAAIGNTNHQRLNAITNESCQYNVSGGGPSGLTVSHFRFHNMRSSSTTTPESTRYLLAATDTNTSIAPGGLFAVRTKIKCTGGDCASMAVNLRYQKNGSGGYALIPDTCGADNIAMIGTSNTSADIPAQGTATTEQLTSDFATNVAGAIARTSSAIPNIDLSQDSETEVEHLIQICSGATIGHYYEFKPHKQDGTELDAYTVTPRATLSSSRFTQ